MEDAMRKKTHKQQRKSSADALLKTKTRDIELTEKELGQVTGGDKSTTIEFPVASKTTTPTKGTDYWPVLTKA
jgi:hypothetical protein